MKIAKRVSTKYTFGYFEADDIEQEAFLIGLDGLTRWDEVRQLENFLQVHISNRLKTFMRDNYYRVDAGPTQEAKKNIMYYVSIQGEPCVKMDEKELLDIKKFINLHLPTYLRKDYLRMCAGTKVTKNTRVKVTDALMEIAEKYNDQKKKNG